MKTEKKVLINTKSIRMLTLRLAAVVTMMNLLISLSVGLPHQTTAGRGIQDRNPPPSARTILLGRTYSGGDLNPSSPFESQVIVNARVKVYFQWSTTQQGVTLAKWQVTDSPGGFPAGDVAVPANIIAQGQTQEIPAAGQTRQFEINFKYLLSPTPPNTPKHYYVRLIPQKGEQRLAPSSSVKITYTRPGEQPVFENVEADLNKFANNLRMRLDGKTTGYSYAIYQYETLKKSGAGGHAVLPNIAQSPDRRMTTMSMSKTITAAAVMKALEQMNEGVRRYGRTFTIDSKIALFLPSDWQLGPHVSEMTLKDLLTHTSGLREVGNDPASYEGLRQVIANGSTDANFRKYKYVNMNFCLLRIIVPYMLNGRTAIEKLSSIEARTTGLFLSFVKQKVLGPVGLSGVSVAPSGPQEEVRYYNFHNPLQYTVDESYERASARSGASSWFMSVKEFGKFIAALRAGKIVSAASFKQMTDNNLGMFGENSLHGRYWNHNGILNWGNGSGSRADWMIFPNGITAVVLINSTGGLEDATQEVVKKAFNTSW
jgi:CubicO group peptidase (beta-lactamase class C family)